MLGRHFLLGGAALAALGWRMADPKGSYAALYDASHMATEWLQGYELVSRLVSLILVDQFNGLMLGIALSALIYMMLGALRRAARLPFEMMKREKAPLSRYAVPRRRRIAFA